MDARSIFSSFSFSVLSESAPQETAARTNKAKKNPKKRYAAFDFFFMTYSWSRSVPAPALPPLVTMAALFFEVPIAAPRNQDHDQLNGFWFTFHPLYRKVNTKKKFLRNSNLYIFFSEQP